MNETDNTTTPLLDTGTLAEREARVNAALPGWQAWAIMTITKTIHWNARPEGAPAAVVTEQTGPADLITAVRRYERYRQAPARDAGASCSVRDVQHRPRRSRTATGACHRPGEAERPAYRDGRRRVMRYRKMAAAGAALAAVALAACSAGTPAPTATASTPASAVIAAQGTAGVAANPVPILKKTGAVVPAGSVNGGRCVRRPLREWRRSA
jgi:hypothetical protein